MVRFKTKTPRRQVQNQRVQDDPQSGYDTAEEEGEKAGIVLPAEKQKMQQLYTTGPRAFGSVEDL